MPADVICVRLLFKRWNLEKPDNVGEIVKSLEILKDMGYNAKLIEKLASDQTVSWLFLTMIRLESLAILRTLSADRNCNKLLLYVI